MNQELEFRRVLGLMGIVTVLAVMFLLARSSELTVLGGLTNPGLPAAEARVAVPDPRESRPAYDFLVVEDPTDPMHEELRASVELALDAFGQNPTYAETPTRDEIYSARGAVIITATFLDRIGDITTYLDYARDGGVLVFAIRPEVNHTFMGIYQQLGIIEHGFFAWSRGFHLRAGYLGGEPFDVTGDWLANSAIQLHVLSECDVIASDDTGVPQIWTRQYGKGRILVMNNSLMTYKATGGLFAAVLAELKGPLLYPVINARVFALESFPLPGDVNREGMSALYMRSGSAFLRDVWWPDMVRLSLRYGLPFSAGVLTGYADEEAYPSYDKAADDVGLVFYAKEISKYGGELGLTGFNQKPLYFAALKEQMQFEPWSSSADAAARTAQTVAMLRTFLPAYEMSFYLPPERILDEEGRAVIAAAMPGLQVICGDFYDRDLWYQDFGVDADGIVRLPVVTSGFTGGHEALWNLLCTAAAKGIVFHSGDVTDLMLETDPTRDWASLSLEFRTFAEEGFGATSYLEGMTLTRAAARVREMTALNPTITSRPGALDVTCTLLGERGYFYLLCPGLAPAAGEGYTAERIFDGRYLITATREAFSIALVTP